MLTALVARLTYANLASTLALFLALGGVSYAAVKLPRNSVGAKQLRKNAVTSVKIKNRAVTATKIGRNAVTGFHVDEATLEPVPDSRRATSAGSAPIARLDYEDTVTAVPAGTSVTGTASCPNGLNLAGGGARVADDTTTSVNDSGPLNRATWQATASAVPTDDGSMTVYAICASAASVTP